MAYTDSRSNSQRNSVLGAIDSFIQDFHNLEGPHGLRGRHPAHTAPMITGEALAALPDDAIPQCALYGQAKSHKMFSSGPTPAQTPLLINTNGPFSGIICGAQGSGRRHSTAVLLESCLIRDSRLGSLAAPLAALVLRFNSTAGGGPVRACELAHLASLNPTRGGTAVPPPVTVLVLPSNLPAMKQAYAHLPQVQVHPLQFNLRDISGDRLLAILRVDESTQSPLYMQRIMALFRDMHEFDYGHFRAMARRKHLSLDPRGALELRLGLLDLCVKDAATESSVVTRFKPGTITIVDLSSPFMDAASACGFFDIMLGLFVHADVGAGKILVLDDAHEYLSGADDLSPFADSLLRVGRQQCHLNTSVVVSTQDPTFVPAKLLELCSFIFAHRFASPKWLHYLAQYVPMSNADAGKLLSQVITLQTGQAIVFAPTGLIYRSTCSNGTGCAVLLAQSYLLAQSRPLITQESDQVPRSTQSHASELGVALEDPPVEAPADTSALEHRESDTGTIPAPTSVPSRHSPPPAPHMSDESSTEGDHDWVKVIAQVGLNDRTLSSSTFEVPCHSRIVSESNNDPIATVITQPPSPSLSSASADPYITTARVVAPMAESLSEHASVSSVGVSGAASEYGTADTSPDVQPLDCDGDDVPELPLRVAEETESHDLSEGTAGLQSSNAEDGDEDAGSPSVTDKPPSVDARENMSTPLHPTPLVPASDPSRNAAAVRNAIHGVPEEYQELAHELLLREGNGQHQHSLEDIHQVLRDVGAVPHNYAPFLEFIEVAERHHVVVREGSWVGLGLALHNPPPQEATAPQAVPEQWVSSVPAPLTSAAPVDEVVGVYVQSRPPTSPPPSTFPPPSIRTLSAGSSSSTQPTTSTAAYATNAADLARPPTRLAPLIAVLEEQRAMGGDRCMWVYVEAKLREEGSLSRSEVDIAALFQEAALTGWVELGQTPAGTHWARLIRRSASPTVPAITTRASTSAHPTVRAIEPRFMPLVNILREQRVATGEDWSSFAWLASRLGMLRQAQLPAGKRPVRNYMLAAVLAGIVEERGSGNDKVVKLTV